MMEVQEDRSNGFNSRNMSNREVNAWSRLALKLGVEDTFYSPEFRKIGTKRFTWKRERPSSWSRLDRCYASLALRSKGGTHGIWPHLDYISDHAGIFLTIPLGKKKVQKRSFFNKSLISNENAMDRFVLAWKDAMNSPSNYCKGTRISVLFEQTRRLSTNISADQKDHARRTYKDQFSEVVQAEEALQRDWTDLDAWENLNSAQAALEEIRLKKLEASKNATAARWIQVGDRCSKEFFEFHKEHKNKSSISHLQDGDRLLTEEKDIFAYIHGYYKDLYSNDSAVEANLAGRARCLQSVPRLISHDINETLTSPIRMEEVLTALKEMPTDNAPGFDSVPKELIQELWDNIGDDMLEFINDSLNAGTLHSSFKYGLTSLIPKEGPLSAIRNYRPISVLSAVYKLIAESDWLTGFNRSYPAAYSPPRLHMSKAVTYSIM
ncbi:hypothetical protein M758_3G189600 [Ceratodon purpureus]|nr:hypothetical protein M758_3G189600 [Ceratodon purpureus]